MIPYLFIFFISWVLLFSVNSRSLQVQRVVSYGLLVVLLFFSSLRGMVGTDTFSYHQIYNDIDLLEWLNIYARVEPLFALLFDFFHALGASSYIAVASVAILQFIAMVKLISVVNRPAEFLILYIAIFYLNFGFNIIRAGLSVLFLLLAIYYILCEKRIKPFFIFGGMAVLFHYSALVIFLPVLYFSVRGALLKVIVTSFSILVVFFMALLLSDNSDFVGKVLLYASLFETGNFKFGTTLFYVLPIYALFFVCVINNENKFLISGIFIAWLTIRLLTIFYGIVGRFEIILNCMLLFIVVQCRLDGLRKQIRTFLIYILSLCWIISNIYSIINETQFVQAPDGSMVDNVSPFNPYHFFWDVN